MNTINYRKSQRGEPADAICLNMTGVIKFRPLYMERVWGGRKLEGIYGRGLPDDSAPFGESWEIVDREAEQSVVEGGEFAGKSLHELWCHHREQVFGAGLPESGRFPILLKILDARERLSVQVHPPADVAHQLGGEPKTEMWYVAHAEPGAEIYAGLCAGVTREDFERGVGEGTTASQVHRIAVSNGDFIFIPSGRLHAIGAGLVIFEIQENSDTTYRVYDWERAGLDGRPRELHVGESLRCIDFNDSEPAAGTAQGDVLVECPQFKVECWQLPTGGARVAGGDGCFALLAVVAGTLRCGEREFSPGDFFLVPAAGGVSLEAGTAVTLLHTTLPVEG
ncbi:MAG: type I phosphomannose isomerase catalytic subunit [Verrucomicrobiales bacterium]